MTIDLAHTRNLSPEEKGALPAHFARGLEIADPLELLSAAERRRVVEEFNARRAEHPREAFVHEGFEAQVARTPGAAALVFEDETLSYAELNARANRLAHRLLALGVGPDARVGICAERSLEMVVGVLGVLKAGGVYVPLDPGYPAERLAYTLADSAPSAVLVQTRLRDRVESADVLVIELDAAAPAWASLPATDPGRGGLTPEHLAYVIYTSGSTGRPKGVRVPHGSLGATLAAAGEAFGFGAGDRVPSLASFAFDIWLFETLLPLLGGGTVRLVPRERVPDVPRLVEDLAWCTALHAVPALMRRIVEEVRATPAGVLGTLRHAFVGGDAVAPDLLEEMRAAFPAAGIHVLYGPTEAAIICAAHRLGGDAAARQMVGRPLGNAALYVVEPGGSVAPVGVPGELCLGGASVARDYLGRPGLTAERFVPDPFATQPGARLYRTGDRVRWLADGSLEFLGRTDFQVKVRGFRIEPGEIEARLAEHRGVRAPVVLAREDAPGDRRLVAYYLADAPVAVDALKSHLAERLPEYMVPAAYVWMETYPLTPNGKLDRKALPAPDGDAYAGREYEAPVGETEQAVAAIWAEVLGAGRVGRHDDFLDLGGHSLLATQVASRVRELFGVELPLSALFEGPTVAELAERVEEVRQAELPVVPPVVPIERTGPLPLSFAQERLWFLHQMEPEGTRYNGPWPSRLRGHLDASALERALNELVRRHEALRTTFRPVERGAVQIVHFPSPAHLPVLDLTGLAPQDREDEARRLAQEDAERLFDLERGPLLRATLLRLSGEEHVLLLTMHHIVSDGWSMDVLFRELLTLYEWFSRPSVAAGAASPLPPLAVQYADFAVWQRGWLRGEVLRRQIDWWRERLGGAPPALELPTDRPRPAVASSRGAAHVFRIPAEITRGLRSLARREGATLYMVTHAAFDLLLSRWSGQEDLVVGSPIAGRTQRGTEGLIGFFVNTLALRIDLSGDPSFQELLGRVRETALGAYAHQELPFERLVEEVAPDRGLSHTPLFQVMFALQNLGYGEGPAIAGLRLEPFGSEVRTFGSESGTVRFDLELDITEAGEELAGSLRFRTDLFDAATMERFAAQYRAVLAAAVASPEERLSRLSILPDEEAWQILVFGAGPARDGTGDAPVHLLFAEQAARTPDAPAILIAGESLSYAELDARAERLARRLRGLGVGTGTAVAVCLERGAGTVVALLAVWKAGGVYLPLDPSHPVERLSFFLRDSGAKLVISDLPLAGALLEREADVLLLDPSAQGDLPGGELERRGGCGPGDLAYLIYTSGSTGTPKAVMVEHAQLTHTLRASLDTLGFAPGDVVAALASTAFDISLLELITPLLTGGAVRIVPHEVARDPEMLVEAAADVTVLHAVPALMRQVVEVVRDGRMLPRTRLLLVGGDMVPPGLLEDMRELFPAARTRVLYGPTEGTIICATYAVPAEGAVAGHPLGRPLPDVRLAVRGPRGELAPVGVPGEVWISGGGVARGYLGRPELNAEKFVGAGAERAYRTGDRARWRADGVLEFLGRADEQVKVRGFRIEPGEIEAVLRGQPGVREAVVLAREDAPGDRRLVAYVVPGADGVETAGGRAQVSEWETLFDDTYAQDEAEEDPTLALKGWNSSYTGEPIPREEMRAWVEDTAERILALRPERVLEVGCGTGLLLFRVAPHTRAYHGTDFSGVALAHVRRHAAGLPQVSLAVREADRLDDYAGAEFDVVVVNSVAQYFPDVDYLLRVLEGAAAALRPGGRIFVGDVRSLPLAGAFHASVELARAPEGLSAGQLQARVRRGMAEEQELLLDPALFEALRARIPRLGRVEVQVKRGEYDNEVSRFRYDVVLHLDAGLADAVDPAVREWGGEDASGLRALAEGSASALLVRGVPDARVREHVRAYELVSAGGEAASAADVRALAGAGAGDGVQPEALFALGEEMGRAVEVRPGAAGTLDVLLHAAADVARFPAAVDAEQPWEAYANDPQWGRRMRALVPALREAARARLPEYMVPSAFVVLEAFPVTANGKVDRGSLPAPDTLGSGGGAYVAPRTPAEERMAGIWAEVLGVERVGGEDNFFDLGGHSLLATQLVSRVREAFRTELPLRAVFEAPVLAALAGRVEVLRAEMGGDAGAPPLVPVPRDGSPLPLSFAQQRQWFIDQMEGAGAAYHVAWRVRLRGDLDRTALARALERIVERHESLRTTFPAVQGEPEQRVAPSSEHGFTLRDHDLTGCADAEGELRRLAEEEFAAPFALAVGPLVRGRLVRMGPDDHALLLTMHHVVSDGWSIGVLARELEVLYTAFSRGEADPLPPLPVQYADYALWHRLWVGSHAVEAQAEYWTETLAGAPELLELPMDRPRPARQDFTGASVKVELDEALTAALRTLSQRHGTTPFMTLLAGWAVVLARLSGQDDVVVGTPIAGRTRGEVEGLIGFFVNTLAVRVDLSGAPTVAELLKRVRERALEAQQNQDFPFEQVVERVRPARSLSHTPLFQVALAWQEMTGGEVELPGIAAAPLDGVEEEAAAFDLMLSLAPNGGRITGDANYATALFDRVTVERWVGYLHRVLQAMVADDRAPVDRLELLSAAERRQVVEEWNATGVAFPAGACVHERFEAQVERTPGAVAVVFEGERVTYAELNARANRLAHHLRARGVGPDARVGICVERSVEMVVGLLGILKAGGAYVPLDASYPVERLRHMLEDSAPAVLLTHPPQAATTAALSAGSAIPVLDLSADEAWAAHPATNPGRDGVGAANLAHVLFTSGSTGRPKGVMLEHGSLVNRLQWMQDRYGMTPDEVLLQKTPFSFDVSFCEFFWPLMVGARLMMARPDGHRDPAYLVETIRREGITHAHFVPSMLQLFLEHPDAATCTGLLRVPVSGEAVSAALVRHFHERLPGVELTNQYGPTESGEVTEWACDPGAERVSIGRAIHNSAVYVVDRAGEPVPVGVAGELFIGGVAVGRGYLGRPRLTAERFIPDPFGAPGARMYRTGDLCRWLPNATLEYLGRTDFQVKVRGFRVEPGEIEARLSAHPGVREAVVLALDDAAGGKRLVAYFVGEALESEALRAHLSEQLPEYMVPAAFVRLGTLPLTPNGKLDRRALPAPGADAFAARAYEAPVGEVENVLAGIWSELLGVERVGRGDHFFALGGHSLLAVRVLSRVRQALGVDASLGGLFERPVLADLARGLETATAEGSAIVPVERGGPVPLSFAQQRLWFLEQLGNLASTYHLPMGLRLRGHLDRGALVRSLDRIVARHEALRTSFAVVDGEPVQRIAPAGESAFRLVEHDLHAAPDAEDELRRLMRGEATAPFDLERGPLARGRLVRLAADDHVLLLTMHHIVSDGWSVGVLHRELGALYAAFVHGRGDPLPPLPVQYADYAVWHRRWVEGPVLEAQAEYWLTTLAGAPELLELPTDHPRPAKQDFTGALVKVELDEALTAALRTLSQRHGTTLFMTLLAGWAAVLSRLSGQDHVVVGTPSANRGRSEIEGLIGFFVNMLPVRVDLSGAPAVAEALGRVKARALEAQANQDIPFEQVVERVQPVRSLSHTPLFQVMFDWQNAPGESLALPGLAVDPLDPLDPAGSGGSPSEMSAKFDLSLALREEGGRIEGGVEYATALFERETVERYAGYLRRVLEGMAAGDAAPVHRLDLLSAAERRMVVEEWNATDAAFPAGACVHELFEAQVERTPGAEAVSFEGERLTYAELNTRANRLAHHLRALGVGPDMRVAVCVERGLETVVALLAVLKAGGGYVPLDPLHPEERLRFALEDSAPAAVLTQAPLAASFEGAGVPVVDLGGHAAWDAQPVSNPGPAGVGVSPEHLAYVIYTSGSTGRPKGVLVPHGSLASLLSVTRAAFGVGPGDVMPALASTAFDISLFELLLPLVSGAVVRVVARERLMDLRALFDAITDATLLHAVPALMREIAQAERQAPSLARLRGTFVGGDQVPPALLAEMSAAFPAAWTHVLYGPTEATILASAHAVPADGAVAGHPIGGPLGNVRLYVCDAFGSPHPVGVAGELLIGGMGVARGYLGRPALTAERFVPDPFSALPGARLYRSGDRARWKDTGVLEFLGRTDFQVKIRGFRIEPGEVEARLREHPAVRQAVVLAREDVPGVKRLVAYVVGEAEADVLRAHLDARLPPYMVPSAFVRLEALPLTSNGKLDRGALPAPDAGAYVARGKEPPLTLGERVLAEIWTELLGVERVGRRDHFFDLGGNSLLAVRLVSRAREALNPAATVEDVFAHPTLYGLAARLQGNGEWFGTDHAIPVRETGSEPPLFVAHDAVGIVFYGQILRPHLDAEIPVYALPGPLNDTSELASLDDLVTRLVRMMVEVQPEGPYRIAGWSAGGIFAYAVAERLVKTGRAVEFVGMLDSSYPALLPNQDSPRTRQLSVLDLLARDSGMPPPTPEAVKALMEDTEGLDLPGFIATAKARGLLPETITPARAEQVDSRIALIKRSHSAYVPGPLPFPVYLFSSDEETNDPYRGWRDMPGGAPFRLVRVPGTHHTMWKKGNVEVVGAAISDAIRASAAGG